MVHTIYVMVDNLFALMCVTYHNYCLFRQQWVYLPWFWQIIKKTRFPHWGETLELDLEPEELSDEALITVEVWDWDMVGKNDFLGKVTSKIMMIAHTRGSMHSPVFLHRLLWSDVLWFSSFVFVIHRLKSPSLACTRHLYCRAGFVCSHWETMMTMQGKDYCCVCVTLYWVFMFIAWKTPDQQKSL